MEGEGGSGAEDEEREFFLFFSFVEVEMKGTIIAVFYYRLCPDLLNNDYAHS